MKKKELKIQAHRNCRLNIICCKNTEGIIKYAEGKGFEVPEKKNEPNGLFCKRVNKFYVIFHKNSTPGEIAHEVTHFLNTLYYAINQNLDGMNDELYCSMLGNFVDECMEFQNKIK